MQKYIDLALLLAAKTAIALWIAHLGFSHVSDDDYARVVIAQRFVHHPQLDPSGTSWLPFPFWLNGSVMIAFGRTLTVARAVALTSGAIVVIPVYLALRTLGLDRWTTLLSVIAASLIPWNAWLAAAFVPEALTGGLIAAAALLVGTPRYHVLAALFLVAASLSRYEAWPVCATLAVMATVSAIRNRHGSVPFRIELAAIALALFGPIAWMAWNAWSHGSPLHFLDRVSRYRRAIGASSIPWETKLLDYPLSLARSAYALLPLSIGGLVGLSDAAFRMRWVMPLTTSTAIMAFLIVGDLSDGAPTHHPERALVAYFWILSAFGIDGVRLAIDRWSRPEMPSRRILFGILAAVGILVGGDWIAGWHRYPGSSPSEDRSAQLARGQQLRETNTSPITLLPCAHEHFALLAAYEAPENATLLPSVPGPETGSGCPRVVLPQTAPSPTFER